MSRHGQASLGLRAAFDLWDLAGWSGVLRVEMR